MIYLNKLLRGATVANNKRNKDSEVSLKRFFVECLLIFLVVFGTGLFLNRHVFALEQVAGPSMQPAFETGDRVVAVRNAQVHRGDIVILDAPDQPGALYIKRVIGLPGNTVSSNNDITYINGKSLKETYLTQFKRRLPNGDQYTQDFTLSSLSLAAKVPKNSYFVMGDHRNVSSDSRRFGYVKKSAIVGVVKMKFWPVSAFKFY